MDTLLIVDDDRLIRWTLRQRLEEEGHQVLEAKDGVEALSRLEEGVDLTLLDYRLPDTDGLELLERMTELEPDVPVIMLTAHSTVDRAVAAMKAGAYHYAAKPFDMEELVLLVARALETTRMRRELRALRGDGGGAEKFDALVGASREMTEVKGLMARVAESPSSTVLINGETGTGKGLAARALHRNSDRRDGPLQTITCSALAPNLLESELFGHERGAFTGARRAKKGLFELAAGGTLFLDEIGELDYGLQSKLLRFLEEKVFRRVGGTVDISADVRIVAATNAELQKMVSEGTFRRDLYYRLAVLTVTLPPLRDREGDVARLAHHFLEQFNEEFRKSVEGITPEGLERLEGYHWPGNVRELRNVMERAVLLAAGTTLDADDFSVVPRQAAAANAEDFVLPPGGVVMEDLERTLLEQALERTGGNQRKAAALLGMNRDQIRYRIDKFELRKQKKA